MKVMSLAQWYQMPTRADEPHQGLVREGILQEAYAFTAFGVAENRVLLRTPSGRVLCETVEVDGCKLVWFDYVPDGRWTRTRFWMNASSVASLGNMLRQKRDKRQTFDSIFFN
jgi:hypothetical protein